MNPEFSRDIEDAMLESYKNLPKLPGKNLVYSRCQCFYG